MAKKVSALLVALLIFKSIGATDSDTQKVAAIQKRRYFSGDINNPAAVIPYLCHKNLF